MTTTLAIANQKGGVAKTTSVASIGAALAELGHSVLLVDLDPQACLTFSLGIDPEDLEVSIHHVLTKGLDPAEVIIATEDGVDLLPATIELARAEADLLTRTGREHVLKGALEDLGEGRDYDWVLLDCPPSLGVLTVAALTAADGVLIPLQCETLSHRGVGQLLDTVHDVRRFTNRALEVWGVLPTHVRRAHQPRPHRAGDDLGHLRPDGDRAADPEDHQVRGGARRRPVDPAHQPVQQGRQGLPRGGRRPGRPGPPTRAEEARRRAAVTAQPRYGRLALLCAAAGVTLVSVLGGMGALPSSADDGATARPRDGLVLSGAVAAPTPSAAEATTAVPPSTLEQPVGESPAAEALPADSGTGRRVVFSEGLQRVWLVGRRRRRAAHLPGLGQRLRQPRPRHATRSTPARSRPGGSTTRGR